MYGGMKFYKGCYFCLRKSFNLRVKASKNYQEKNINFADDYREMP